MAAKEEERVNHIASIFTSFQEHLNSEQQKREEIRDAVKDLEQTSREILAVAQRAHQISTETGIKDISQKILEKFSTCKKQIGVIAEKIPIGQYYRFYDHWRMTMQRLTFLGSFEIYLEHERLATRQEIAELLGVQLDWKDGFFLDLDDYLMGLLLLANELSRLAINSVTAGNYKRPSSIATFLSELDVAFRLLNLKNDSLRKKFDGLKYDLKKVEEVVYDLTIRGLRNDESCQNDSTLDP